MSSEVAAEASGAIVSITAHVPEDAMSAGLLGTERIGHGVRIRDDGLIATIGYVVHEAENLWIGTRDTVECLFTSYFADAKGEGAATDAFEAALACECSDPERRFLERKLAMC